jgi:hypothetical protein
MLMGMETHEQPGQRVRREHHLKARLCLATMQLAEAERERL